MDGIKFWYFEWYFYICGTIRYFTMKKQFGNVDHNHDHDNDVTKLEKENDYDINHNNHDQLLIFDIENDSIDKIIHFFKDKIVLDSMYWQHHHKSKQAIVEKNHYPKLMKTLEQMINQHASLYSNYSETEHAVNHVCPKYFWMNQSSNSDVNDIDQQSGWNLFWREFIDLANKAHEIIR